MKNLYKPLLLVLLSGLLVALSFEPFAITFLVFFAYVPLFFVLENEERFKYLLLFCWISMFFQTLIGFQWVQFVSMEFGELPWIISTLILTGFALLTNFSLQIFSLLLHLARRFLPPGKRGYAYYFLIIPSCFTLSEVLDPKVFNWSAGNIILPYIDLAQFADILGVPGLTFAVIVFNISVFLIIRNIIAKRFFKTIVPASVFIVLLSGMAVYGKYSFSSITAVQNTCPVIKTAVIQANIGNSLKLEVGKAVEIRGSLGIKKYIPSQMLILKKYEALTREAIEQDNDIELVVWPETAFPGDYIETNPYMQAHRKFVEETG
ncbi:MAG: hypothetical protein JXA66_06400, partial [Oligoflexia bacterium]|nr:hypothetical protein [Oligoflexia bacterium]